MNQAIYILLLLFALFLGCKSNNEKSIERLSITDPKLVEFETTDTIVKQAVIKAINYLSKEENKTDIKDFYLNEIKIHQDTIKLMINHADYYLVKQMMEEEEKTDEFLWMPPTGNWSGKDRTILYLTKKDSIIDVLDQ